MKMLLVSNMYPSQDDPIFGSFIENNYNGFIYDSNTPSELNKVLIDLLKDKNNIYLIGENAFNCDFSDFRNYDKVVQEILNGCK
jgi:hypothetical protein